jgi:hypothetical protein
MSVTATLNAKDVGMSKAMEKVAGAVHHAESQLDKFKDKFKEAFSFGMGAGVGAMAGEKLAEGIKSAAEALPEFAEKMETISNSAKKAGMDAEGYQRLAYAMKSVGIPAESMDGALKKLNVGMAKLRVHQGPILEGLKRLNPELVHQLMSTKSGEEAFLAVADAVQKETDATKRAAIANAVFGKSGVEMLPALLLGKEGLQKLTEGAVVASDKTVESGERMQENLVKIGAAFDNMKNAILGDIAEGLNPYLEATAKWMSENQGIVKTLEGIGIAALALVGIFAVVKGSFMFFGTVSSIIKMAGLAWEAYRLYAVGAATAQEALNLVMAANPIGLIVTAVALLVAGIVLLAMNWDTLTGKLSPKVYHAVKGGGSNASASIKADQEAYLAKSQADGTYHRQSRADEAAAHALRVTSSAPVVHVTNYIDGVKQEPSRTEVKTASKSMGRGAAPVARPDTRSQPSY